MLPESAQDAPWFDEAKDCGRTELPLILTEGIFTCGWENRCGTKTPEQAERIQGQLAAFFQTKTKAELAGEARKRGIMLETVNTPIDVLQHPQLEARGFWQQLEHPELGTTITYPARFALLSESPATLGRRAPLVGEHNQEIYRGELGLAEGDLVALKACGAI